ncbi:hypothetical protein PG993_003822 [Apiospora rasikravindrae]|uniref:Uncharacterized protein n=1 Tax=Apiospora rasikravindrae TaxID=990691 RepID=A0ABR1U0M0_9PEZI
MPPHVGKLTYGSVRTAPSEGDDNEPFNKQPCVMASPRALNTRMVLDAGNRSTPSRRYSKSPEVSKRGAIYYAWWSTLGDLAKGQQSLEISNRRDQYLSWSILTGRPDSDPANLPAP